MNYLMEKKIAVIGLGYVGLPLAIEFASKYPTIGFDINESRVKEIMSGTDSTLEVENEKLQQRLNPALLSYDNKAPGLYCSTKISDIQSANYFIITVPTPTDRDKRPDLKPLIKASTTVGSVLKKGDYVIYESTVYPGVTEEECVPVLETMSSLKLNKDFFVGYSPERINPGDKKRILTKILKVTSGSTPEAAIVIDNLYQEIIEAGTYLAPSIKIAEASKVIENSQRDINIAFINELAKIFNILDIDTNEVLKASSTKWNFLPFKPGLVGGHCIGVDPYYLAQKAQVSGYYPEIILAGRRINDSMGSYVATQIIKKMLRKGLDIKGSKTLILGFTFKENCPDIRNTRVIDIYKDLKELGLDVKVFDPLANPNEVLYEYGINIEATTDVLKATYSCIILAVGHEEFREIDIESLKEPNSIVYDIKGFLPKNCSDSRL